MGAVSVIVEAYQGGYAHATPHKGGAALPLTSLRLVRALKPDSEPSEVQGTSFSGDSST